MLDNNKSFHLSKHAVEFRNLKQGDEVVVVIPEKDNGSDYAAIDKLAHKENTISNTNSVKSIANKPQENKSESKPVEKLEKKVEKVELTDEDLL